MTFLDPRTFLNQSVDVVVGKSQWLSRRLWVGVVLAAPCPASAVSVVLSRRGSTFSDRSPEAHSAPCRDKAQCDAVFTRHPQSLADSFSTTPTMGDFFPAIRTPGRRRETHVAHAP